jgi:cysteine synthase A
MKIANSVSDLIGNTPLVELHNFQTANCCKAHIIAKLEFFNPAGSVKDRVGKAMIEDAEQKGLLREGSVIIEPTSGNTGIGLVAVAMVKGYRVILTMPETMSIERRNLLRAYGAEIVLTDGDLGMRGSILKAQELAAEIPNSFIPGQFTNKANPMIHKKTTGPEIWNDMDGTVDIFIAGIGTGGTITGTGEYLKEKNQNIKVIGVEPATSPFITKGTSGSHMLQGIGAGFIPEIFNQNLCDEIITVKNEDAFAMCKLLTKTEGLLVGISSGAVLQAALEISKRPDSENKRIVVLLPDTGERYLTTPMYLD